MSTALQLWRRPLARPAAEPQPQPPRWEGIWNAWGRAGHDNYASERAFLEQTLGRYRRLEGLGDRHCRFQRRAAQYLTGMGLDQWLVLGVGLPDDTPLHQVVHALPEPRSVYASADAEVMMYARALLRPQHQGGQCGYVEADPCDVPSVVAEVKAARMLDLERPVAVVLPLTLALIPRGDEVRQLLKAVVGAVPAGSFVVVSQPANTRPVVKTLKRFTTLSGRATAARSYGQIRAHLGELGLEVVEPEPEPVPPGDPRFPGTGKTSPVDLFGVIAGPTP
jgi:hypothetical protein